MNFLIVQHLDIEPPALIGEVLRDFGHTLHTLHLDQGELLPADASNDSGIIIMGGPQSANDEHLPYIRDELVWLTGQIEAGMPMLGICLGAQLMAKAAGGRVTSSPKRELGWFPVFPTPEASNDPLFGPLPEAGMTVFQWHGETFSLPNAATLLASHPDVPMQAFRLGKAQYGMQFHIEVDEPLLQLWIDAGESERTCLGKEGSNALHEQTSQHLDSMHEACRHMMRNWLEILT